MTTRGPPTGLPMRPLQSHVNPVSAAPSRARPVQATTAMSHHPRSHTQRFTPPSKVALVRSWIGRKKLYLGAAIGILTLFVAVISLLPSFAGSRYGKETLELALWTAKKDYVEACQTYLNHTSIECQQALQKGLPPPPGLDRFAARSLQKLKDDVQWLEIQPLIHETDDHVIWLRLWLQIGTITVALILTGQWTRLTHLVRRQGMRPWYLDRVVDVDLNLRQQEGNGVMMSAILRSHGLSQATATGINVEEGQTTRLRQRTQKAATETTAPNRVVHSAGTERVGKERRRRDPEETTWSKPLSIFRSEFVERELTQEHRWSDFAIEDDTTGGFWSSNRKTSPVMEAKTTSYSSHGTDEYEDWELPEDDSCIAYSCYGKRGTNVLKVRSCWESEYDTKWRYQAWRRLLSSETAAIKQAEQLRRGITSSPWPNPRPEKRNPRKGKRAYLYSQTLDDSDALDRFEDSVPY